MSREKETNVVKKKRENIVGEEETKFVGGKEKCCGRKKKIDATDEEFLSLYFSWPLTINRLLEFGCNHH